MAKPKPRIGRIWPTEEGIKLTAADKAAIERAYGYELPHRAWASIQITTNLFTLSAPSAAVATPIAKAMRLIKRLNLAANALKLEMSEDLTVAPATLEEIARKYFQVANLKAEPNHFLEVLLHGTNAIIAISDYAAQRLSGPNRTEHVHFSEGTMWSLWISDLTWILKEAGLPTGASKIFPKKITDETSAFVKFVHELQRCIPKKLRRHMPSPTAKDQTFYLDALAQGISRARKSTKGEPAAAFMNALGVRWTSAGKLESF